MPIAVTYDNLRFDEGFKADLIVEEKVLIELRSVAALNPVHTKQVATYLRFTNLRLGLLINFGAEKIKDGLKRIARGLPPDEISF